MIRVLIVDDSMVAREILVQVLGMDPEIEVVGVAANGREGVQLAASLKPDLVTMDIEMPEMNGFEATREIMSTLPVPIVICSISTMVSEAENAMRALQAGALTLIAKPMGPASPSYAGDTKCLIETVKAMADVAVIRRRRNPPTSAERERVHAGRRIGVVAIGASAGGPPALQTVLNGLSADFPAPILIVQHLAQGFMEGLVSWLDGLVPLRVSVARDGDLMQPGHVYVAPEDKHLGASSNGSLVLSDAEPIEGFRPSVTYLFDSVAKSFGPAAVGVVLTGMGRDGVDGLGRLHAAGGLVLAQDKESCVVFGMPGAAVEANVVHEILPLERIAAALCHRAGQAAT